MWYEHTLYKSPSSEYLYSEDEGDWFIWNIRNQLHD